MLAFEKRMPEIVMPQRHRSVLAQLLMLSAEQQAVMHSELRASPPLSLPALSARIAGPMKLDLEIAGMLLEMLASMYQAMIRNEETPTRFSALVVDAAKRELATSLPASVDWTAFEQLITALMTLDHSLGVPAKALGVLTDHDHVYQRSRILTDVRPVFTASASEPPAALLTVHTLRVTYRSSRSSEETEGFFVALDTADLEELRTQIDRALEKERTIKALFLSKDLPLLNS
jgi:hypothetical protein